MASSPLRRCAKRLPLRPLSNVPLRQAQASGTRACDLLMYMTIRRTKLRRSVTLKITFQRIQLSRRPRLQPSPSCQLRLRQQRARCQARRGADTSSPAVCALASTCRPGGRRPTHSHAMADAAAGDAAAGESAAAAAGPVLTARPLQAVREALLCPLCKVNAGVGSAAPLLAAASLGAARQRQPF
jgi:hypothetical protein